MDKEGLKLEDQVGIGKEEGILGGNMRETAKTIGGRKVLLSVSIKRNV